MMIHTFHIQAQAMSTGRAPQMAFDELWFEQVFTALDRLHDAASADGSTDVLPVAQDHMVGWLEDIIYTAQETIREIRANVPGNNVTVTGELVHAMGGAFRSGESEEKHGTA